MTFVHSSAFLNCQFIILLIMPYCKLSCLRILTYFRTHLVSLHCLLIISNVNSVVFSWTAAMKINRWFPLESQKLQMGISNHDILKDCNEQYKYHHSVFYKILSLSSLGHYLCCHICLTFSFSHTCCACTSFWIVFNTDLEKVLFLMLQLWCIKVFIIEYCLQM